MSVCTYVFVAPSVEELKDLWLYGFARSSLHEAIACLDELPSAANKTVARALLAAAFIAYGRPFTAWQVTSSERVKPLARIALRELCIFFIDHCETKLRRMTRIDHSEITTKNAGVYELVVSEPPNEWMRPFRP